MNISVIPARCIRAADELRQIERQLNIRHAEIEEVIASLRRTEDESMMHLAAKLSKTAEALRIKIVTTKMISVALSKISGIYARTEDGVADYENYDLIIAKAKYKATPIKRNSGRINKTFEKL